MRLGDLENFEQNREAIYHFILSKVHDHCLADDLVSQTYERVFDRRDRTGEKIINELAYAYKIAENLVNDYYRYKKISNLIPFDDNDVKFEIADPTPGPEEQIISHENNQEESAINQSKLNALKKALETLSEDERKLLQYRFRDGYSCQVIGNKLDIKPSTARKRICRVIIKLKKIMANGGGLHE